MYKNNRFSACALLPAIFLFFIEAEATDRSSELQIAALADKFDEPSVGLRKYFFSKPGESILRCEVDLDGDGTNEVLCAFSTTSHFEEGFHWHVFYKKGTKWAFADENDGTNRAIARLSFNPRMAFAGFIPPAQTRGLATFLGPTNETGSLIIWTLKKGQVSTKSISGFAPTGKDRDAFNNMFGPKAVISHFVQETQ